MKSFFLTILIGLIITTLSAQEDDSFNPNEKFSVDTIRAWTNELFEEVREGHPGMYRYTKPEEFDRAIQLMIDTVNDSITTIEYYRKLKPLFARIGCLHTSITMKKDAFDYYTETLEFIPIEVFINDDKRVFVTKNYDNSNSIPLKSEIISINEQPISEILDLLYSSIPSDGYNQTLKTVLLNHRFAFWYQSMISTTDQFLVKTTLNGVNSSYKLNGISKEEYPTMSSIMGSNEEQLRFETIDNIGHLSIGTFGKSSIKKNGQKFNSFTKNVFKTLREEDIQNLIIDLRNNTGGTDGNAAFLASYFFDEPFNYWKHPVEMTEGMADQFKFWFGIFFKFPKKMDSTYQWKGTRRWLGKEFNYYKEQKPSKYNFTGNVYIITNGGCMSSCADFVAILSFNEKALVVGQETGGGYQGNTSGMMPTTELKGNLQMVTPLQKYTNAVDPQKNIGSGTIPNYVVTPTLESWLSQSDMELEFVKQLIKSKNE